MAVAGGADLDDAPSAAVMAPLGGGFMGDRAGTGGGVDRRAAEAVAGDLRPDDVILLKASRALALETVLEALKE